MKGRTKGMSKQLSVGAVDVPLMAAAMLAGNGAGSNEEVNELLREILREVKDKRQAEREKAERLALQAVEATREATEQRERMQAACSHLKQDNTSTRLVGQRVTGTGQIVLTCQWCAKMYHIPPDPALGQVAPPRNLVPSADGIGG
jgi:hypothetical protein